MVLFLVNLLRQLLTVRSQHHRRRPWELSELFGASVREHVVAVKDEYGVQCALKAVTSNVEREFLLPRNQL